MILHLYLATAVLAVGAVDPFAKDAKERYRLLQEETCDECVDRKDWVSREGLGDSPGIPGVEYLGLGYNIFKGNPRGTDKAELDPGFRQRVIALEQSQGRLSLDQDWMIPFGVQASSASSCQFASTSTEISNEQQYRSSLSKEVTQKDSFNLGLQGVIKSVPVSLSSSLAFESSERMESFRETTSRTQTVSYEAKAICTEFDLHLEPYYDHKNDTAFSAGLKLLADEPFDPVNLTNRQIYYDFIDAFGTHIVTDVVLGAKHIYSTVMKSSDVMELTRQKIDIKSTMSFDVQFAAGSSANGARSDIKDQIEFEKELASSGDSDDNVFIVKIQDCTDNDDDDSMDDAPKEDSSSCKKGVPGKSCNPLIGGSIGFSTSSGTATSSLTERVSKIQEKVVTVNEVNIGGRPPIDGNWKTWAETVRERPMPVVLEVQGLWEFMDDDMTKNFFDAVLLRHGLDLSDRSSSPVLQSMHFGVYTPSALPITSYSASPNDNYRTVINVDRFDPVEVETIEQVLHEGSPGTWSPNEVSCDPGFFACGAEVQYNSYSPELQDIFTDEWKIQGLRFKCCGGADPADQTTKLVYEENEGRGAHGSSNYKWSGFENCPEGEYINGGQVKYSGSGEELGLTALFIRCTGSETYRRVYEYTGDFDGDFKDKIGAPETCQDCVVSGARQKWDAPEKNKKGKVLYKDKQGTTGLGFFFAPVDSFGPKSTLFLYDAQWEGGEAAVSAFFVTMVKGRIVPSTTEDEMWDPPVSADLIQSGVYHPFGIITLSDPSQAAFGVYDFKEQGLAASLEKFAFLSADNLPLEMDMVAGLVHPDGYAVNEEFGKTTGFEVTVTGDSDYNVIFKNYDAIAKGLTGADRNVFSMTPTIIAMPMWFDANSLPEFVGEISVVIKEVVSASAAKIEATLAVGCGSSCNQDQLGFSFLALATDSETKGVIHGQIGTTLSTDNICIGCSVTFPHQKVEITFDQPFEAPPSVIITPNLAGGDYPISDATEMGYVPLSVIEYVTPRKVLVSVGMWDETAMSFTKVPFHFVAVGPPEQPDPVTLFDL